MAVTFNHATSAYRDATRVAEKIISETGGDAAAGASSSNAMKPDFTDLLGTSLDASRDAGYKGEMMSSKSIANGAELHELITAVSNAELTLNTVVAVRDRVITAYQDIIKMPI